MFQNLAEVLQSNHRFADRGITLIWSSEDEKFVSYEQLYNRSMKVLYRLQAAGVTQGDELILQIENEEHFLYVFWACIAGGIIPVPVSTGGNDEHRLKLYKVHETLERPFLAMEEKWMAKLEEHETPGYHVEVLKPGTLFVEELIQGIDMQSPLGQPAAIGRHDIAFIQFSSGSTGNPKGVILTHDNLLCNVEGMSNRIRLTEEDAFLSWMPLTHDMGLIALHITPFVNRLNHSIMSTNALIKRPTLWLIKAQQQGATILGSPNFGYKLLLTAYKPRLAADWDLSRIRLIYNGAEPISIDLCYEFLNAMGVHGLKNTAMFNVYGLAEGTVGVSMPNLGETVHSICVDRNYLEVGKEIRETTKDSNHHLEFAEVGYPIDHVSVRICGDDGSNPLPERFIGNIQIKGRSVTSGYYRNPEATEAVLYPEGWLNTGDLGFMDGGRLFITGRKKDIIFVNGKNIYPHDIERISEEIEGVELGKVAVVGVYNPNEQKDDIIVFVQYKRKLDHFIDIILELRKTINLRTGLEPALVLPVRGIPKTTSGKVQRYKLAEMLLNGEFEEQKLEVEALLAARLKEQQVDLPRNEVEKKVWAVWTELLETERIGIHDNFFAVGGSSSLLLQMVDQIEQLFPGMIEITDPFALPTIAQIASHITSGANSHPLQALPVPKEVIAAVPAGESKGPGTRLSYTFGGEEFARLRELAQMLKVSLHSIGMTALAYMLHQRSTATQVPLSLYLSKGSITEYDFCFDGISDLAAYIQEVHQVYRNEGRVFAVGQLHQLPIIPADHAIYTVYCDQYALQGDESRFHPYDVITIAEEKESYLTFTLTFDEHRLQRRFMEDLLLEFVRLIRFMIRQVDSADSTDFAENKQHPLNPVAAGGSQ